MDQPSVDLVALNPQPIPPRHQDQPGGAQPAAAAARRDDRARGPESPSPCRPRNDQPRAALDRQPRCRPGPGLNLVALNPQPLPPKATGRLRGAQPAAAAAERGDDQLVAVSSLGGAAVLSAVGSLRSVRDGICSRCGGREVYASRNGLSVGGGFPGDFQGHIDPGFRGIRPHHQTDGIWQYACANCGCCETYLLDDALAGRLRAGAAWVAASRGRHVRGRLGGSSVLDHVGSRQSATAGRGRAFYENALAPLGLTLPDGARPGRGRLWRGAEALLLDRHAGAVGAQTAIHVAFAAESRELVDAFHAAALEAGGADNGGPGIRWIFPPKLFPARTCSTPTGTTSRPCATRRSSAPRRVGPAPRLPPRLRRHLAHVGARAARARAPARRAGADAGRARGGPPIRGRRPRWPTRSSAPWTRRASRPPNRGQLARRLLALQLASRGRARTVVGARARPAAGRRGTSSYREMLAPPGDDAGDGERPSLTPTRRGLTPRAGAGRRSHRRRLEHIPAELLAHQLAARGLRGGRAADRPRRARRLDPRRRADRLPGRIVWGTGDRLLRGRRPRLATASGCRTPTGSSSKASATARSSTCRSRPRS